MTSQAKPASMYGPCSRCGKVRAINPRRGDLCSSCRHFAIDQPPGEWIEDAACRTYADKEVFWPDKCDSPEIQVAQQICMACPVASQCLQYALDTNQAHGIWGGLTPAGRRTYARMMEAV